MLKFRAVRVVRDQDCAGRYEVRVRVSHAGDVRYLSARVDRAKNTPHAVKLAFQEAAQILA